MSKKEIRDAFAEGWTIESIKPYRVEAPPDVKEFKFSEGGPKRGSLWYGGLAYDK